MCGSTFLGRGSLSSAQLPIGPFGVGAVLTGAAAWALTVGSVSSKPERSDPLMRQPCLSDVSGKPNPGTAQG